MAREFYCGQCRRWLPVDKDEGTRGTRRRHEREHTAEADFFARPDMLELDATLNGWYR
jgi:hypothetical protein